MVSPALTMTAQEKKERAAFKRSTLLLFLASGEQWTTLAVAAELLQTSERTALRLMKKLIAEHLIKVDVGIVPHSNLKLYGISDHGLAVTGAALTLKAFPIGRTNPSWVKHHTQSQRIRIRGEQTGWTDWVSEKLLTVKNSQRLKKLPDFLMTRPDGHKACGELERYCKSKKRLADAMGGHLTQIVSGHYVFVYYFVPDKAAQERAFNRVEFVVVDGNKIKLNDSHRARFKVFLIESWQGEM